MKKSLIALAVLAASGAAMAQSSVTLYGVADAFVGSRERSSVTANTSNELVVSKQRQAVVDSGGLSSSRWGLRVKEDLGAGLNAFATFESNINIDDGASSGFTRQAFVGLGGSFGAVSMGRQYNEFYLVRGKFLSAQSNSNTFDATNGSTFTQAQLNAINVYKANPTGSTTVGTTTTRNSVVAATALNSRIGGLGAWTGNETRVNNSLRYATPDISGFKAAVVFGLGENKTATTDETRSGSGSLSYTNGPVGVALVHSTDELTKGFKLKNTAIGGFYDFGVAKAFLSYNQAKYTGLAKQNEWAVGVSAPIGATTLVAQYAHSKGDDLGKNQSLGLEAQYSLSKRTTAYAGFNQTKLYNDFAKNNVFGLGMRHTF